MQEYVTRAVVLKKEPLRDIDGRYIFFTEHFGKMSAKAKSSRKITGKLAPHLEPGTLAKTRFIERNGAQIIDALKEEKLGITPIDLQFLSRVLPDGEPDKTLWETLTKQQFSWANILKILGWDPESAVCASCGAKTITGFYIPRQEFFCAACALKLRPDEVISM